MHPLLEELHRYHHDLCTTLVQLRKLLACFKDGSCDDAERHQLFALLSSLHGAEEARHHHNEELIRQQLLTTRAPLHKRVLDIERDHQGFARIASQLAALEQSSHTPEEIASVVEDYLRHYNDHMDSEENIFFPMAEEWLDDPRWQAVSQQWQH